MVKKLRDKLKGQALPLNTIVIAILVIIVLLVIIVFFTTQVGDKNETFNANDPTACQNTNPTLNALGYTSVIEVSKGSCTESATTKIAHLKVKDSENNECCATLK